MIFTRTIAVAGSEVTTPQYVKVKIGAKLSDVLADNLKPSSHNIRIINGNPLVGEKTSLEDFLGAHVTEVTAIPEGDDINEVLVGFAHVLISSLLIVATSLGC